MAHLTGKERAQYVARTFDRISRRYDLINTVMTAGRHHAWRRLAAETATAGTKGTALDVATGTGDFAVALAERREVTDVVGIDFAGEMLGLAVRKTARRGMEGRVRYLAGDAHTLPFPDAQFACATVGFGVRSFVDVHQALCEMARVVTPGGKVVVLEIVRMEGRGPFSRVFPLYFRHVTPWIGAFLAGDREAYKYLPESVRRFLSAAEVADLMARAGLRDVTVRRLALSAVAIIAGEKAG